MTKTTAGSEGEYRANKGSHFTQRDIPMIVAELIQIRQNNDELCPELVVEAARPATAPLHRFFEWRDDVAAEKWRREQARYMIRSIEINDPKVGWVKAYHSIQVEVKKESSDSVGPDEDDEDVSTHNGKRFVFMSLNEVQKSNIFMQQIIDAAWEQLAGWHRRFKKYRGVAEFDEYFSNVMDAIDKVPGAPLD